MAGASEILRGDLAARCQIVGGNFFDSVPEGADGYLLKGVIHDWPDDDAVRILRNARRAIPQDGMLVLIERILDSAAGFSLTRIIPTEADSLIECRPA